MKRTVRITALVLAFLMMAVTLVSCSRTVDFKDAKMTKYIKLADEDLSSIPLELTTRDTSDEAVEEYIESLRSSFTEYKKETDKNKVIVMGDSVEVLYRLVVEGENYMGKLSGIYTYSTDDSGNTTAVYAEGSSMNSEDYLTITLGEDSIDPVLEEELGSGKYKLGDFENTKREEKLEGEVLAGDIVYISYKKSYKTDGGVSKSSTVEYDRIDLAGSDKFASLVGKKIGDSFEVVVNEDINGKRDVTYSGTIMFTSKEITKSIDVTFPSDYSVEALRSKSGTYEVVINSLFARGTEPIKKNDIVYTYYRGIITSVTDESYNDYLGSLFDCNYGSTLYAVGVGSGQALTDFENGFIGKTACGKADNAQTSGKIKDVLFDGENLKDLYASIYLSATYTATDGSTVTYIPETEHFVDMTGEGSDALNLFKLSDIEKKVDLAGYFKTCDTELGNYFETIQKIEIEGAERDVLIGGYVRFVIAPSDLDDATYIDATFPDSYSTDSPYLNGATARFYIVVDHVVESIIPDLDDTFIKEDMEFESDKTGDELIAEFRKSIKDYLENSAKAQDISEASSLIWDYLVEKTEVKKYPKGNLKTERETLYQNVKATYNSYKEQYSTTFTDTYPTLESYIIASGGIESADEIDDLLDAQAKSNLEEKMIMYYLIQKLDVILTDEEYEESKKELVAYYAESYSVTEAEILAAYDEESLHLQVYSDILLDKLYEMNKGNITRK